VIVPPALLEQPGGVPEARPSTRKDKLASAHSRRECYHGASVPENFRLSEVCARKVFVKMRYGQMKRQFVIAAALILSACTAMPGGAGYTVASGQHPAKSQHDDYLACEMRHARENPFQTVAETPRETRLKIDACMAEDGWADIILDQYPI
jgi:hypothetical protein